METKLFSPYTVKGVTLKNRIVMSPMCMYSSHNKDGMVEDWHMTHYVSRAVGQVGLVMVEATSVAPEGRISPQDLGIWSDEHVPRFRELVKQIKAHGAKAAIQIAHAGRKAVVDEEIFAPTAIAFNDKMKKPTEMTTEKIQKTIAEFRDGVRRAKEAGFDIIELHGAHGYLINEFLSPISNKRTDEYGGDKRARYRFLEETIEAVKEVWDGPLFVRISANDYLPEGMTPEAYVEVCGWMKEQGVDLIDVSSGAIAPARIHAYPGYQVGYSETIKHGVGIDTGAVGLITTGNQAEEILQNDRADLIFLARALLDDPYWAKTAAKQLGVEITPPVQYERGW
ncbi:NADPH dehydrogenase NamA [Bacillus fonticola]|uniref:NADPH dehydrogenase NamA n=1 Tax=Bacillus fonticola TaxID=2728853 RepID=UPI001472757F|nr:NADPH dehydrogenase NamA [Bacillus fonticola]